MSPKGRGMISNSHHSKKPSTNNDEELMKNLRAA